MKGLRRNSNGWKLENILSQISKLAKQEAGTTIIEFAICSFVLFGLTFGMIDFSLLMYARTVVQSAAQEGAREAIVLDEDGTLRFDDIYAAAKDRLILLDPDKTTINANMISEDTVLVEVEYSFEFITPVGGLINISLPNIWTIAAQAKMVIH